MGLVTRVLLSAAVLGAVAGSGQAAPALAADASSSPVDITPNPSAAGTSTTFAVNCGSQTAAQAATSAILIGTTLGLPEHIPMKASTHSNEFVTTVVLPSGIRAGTYQPDIDCSNGVTASATLTVSPGSAPATGDGSTATATDGPLTAAGLGLAGFGALAGLVLMGRRRRARRG
ncbi:MAG: hypothetical protein ACLPKI_22870 [Streptosporangiaceae bacterium]